MVNAYPFKVVINRDDIHAGDNNEPVTVTLAATTTVGAFISDLPRNAAVHRGYTWAVYAVRPRDDKRLPLAVLDKGERQPKLFVSPDLELLTLGAEGVVRVYCGSCMHQDQAEAFGAISAGQRVGPRRNEITEYLSAAYWADDPGLRDVTRGLFMSGGDAEDAQFQDYFRRYTAQAGLAEPLARILDDLAVFARDGRMTAFLGARRATAALGHHQVGLYILEEQLGNAAMRAIRDRDASELRALLASPEMAAAQDRCFDGLRQGLTALKPAMLA